MWVAGFVLVAGLLGNRLPTADASTDGCPAIVQRSHHFSKVNQNVCYLFVKEEKYWNDARSACWEMGGDMVSIPDGSTMAFIQAVLNSRELGWTNNGVWLGARYITGKWQWTSGAPVEYSFWASGEPSKTLGFMSVEDCALMRRSDNWRWHDFLCGTMKYHYNFICEFPIKGAQSTTTITTTSTTTTSQSTTSIPMGKIGMPSIRPYLIPRGDGSFILWDDRGKEMHSLVLDHSAQGPVASYPFKLHPAFNVNGDYQAHSAAESKDNGNMTILTIILTAGGIVLLILLMVFLIVRKQYNYQKTAAEPSVLFDNRDYNHNQQHLPPPPTPHQSHPVHAVSNSDLYLTPTQLAETGGYEEIGPLNEKTAYLVKYCKSKRSSLTSTPPHNDDGLGACGGLRESEDSVTVPLVSAQQELAMLSQSEESLHSMSGSLTMKTSSMHNDYVDMNGTPVAPGWQFANAGPPSPALAAKENDQSCCGHGKASSNMHATLLEPLDTGSDYSNLMSASQRSENLYEQLC